MATVREVMEQGLARHKAGDFAEAERLYRQVLRDYPTHPDALHLVGMVALQTGRPEQALASIRQAIALQPGTSSFHCNLARAHQALGRLDEAVAEFRESLRLAPDFAEGHAALGAALLAQQKNDEAVTCFEQALRLGPESAVVRNDLGTALHRLKQDDQAAACYRRALELDSQFTLAYHNLGLVLQRQGKLREAIGCFREALRRNPGVAATHCLLGNALKDLGKWDEAETCYREAIRLNPAYTDAINQLGAILADLHGEVEEALACYRRVLALEPDCAITHSNSLFALHYHHGNDPHRLLEEHLRWARTHAEPLTPACPRHDNDPDPDRPLRLGFLMGHLGWHPAHFLQPVLAALDRSRAHVVCYLSSRLAGARDDHLRDLVDGWHEVVGWSNEQVARLVREERIDVLVDLAGHTSGCRLLACARRPAPVQITQFGYPNTTAMTAIPYRITDPYLDPPGRTDPFYTEELIRLPEIAWCFQPPPCPLPNRLPALESGRFTFASFNKLSKYTGEVIALWAQVLKAVPGSRLLLAASGSRGDDRIRQAFERHGVGGQVEMRPRRGVGDYMKMYHEVDVGLDPFPFTGGVTTCDALWMGVPVISLAGSTCVARQGVSFLSNVGLADWVAQTPEAVVDVARRWAADLPALARLRAGLRDVVQQSPLVDGQRYVRHLERVYRDLWRRWCASRDGRR